MIYTLVVILYLFVLLIAADFAWSQSYMQVGEFMKLFAVYAAPLTALLAALISFLNVREQASIQASIETLKVGLSEKLEGLKTRLSLKSKAVDTTFANVYAAYHSLADIEQGTYDEDRAEAADAELNKGAHHLAYLNGACKNPFNQFRQRVRYLRERIKKVATNEERLALWRDCSGAGELNLFIEDLQRAIHAHHAEIVSAAQLGVPPDPTASAASPLRQ